MALSRLFLLNPYNNYEESTITIILPISQMNKLRLGLNVLPKITVRKRSRLLTIPKIKPHYSGLTGE